MYKRPLRKKIAVFFRLYWIRILLVIILFPVLILGISVIIYGLSVFFNLESFYRQITLASFPFQIYLTILSAFCFATIYMGFHYWFLYGGGLAKMHAKRKIADKAKITWQDVIGMEKIKEEVWEVINLLRDRTITNKTGGKIIKGVLLIGPPGCGKTYIAKAIATETGLPFISAVGSEFQQMFVGVGAMRIRQLFKEARKQAQLYGGCIIFIDEIDIIAQRRVTPSGFGGGIDYNATINQLLTEMDGLKSAEDNIVVFGATNMPEEEFDPALMRPGRFDRKIYVSLPGLEDRKKIIKYYLAKLNNDFSSIDIDYLARLTVGNSPADIYNIIHEASLISSRKKKTSIDIDDINAARERIVLGIKQEIEITPEKKRFVAYHEAGHVLITYLLVPTKDVFKASIIPRRHNLGSVWAENKEEVFLLTKEDILNEIKTSLAGYAAEKMKFGYTSTGVEGDLKKANFLAEQMILRWGMGGTGPASYSAQINYNPSIESDKDTIINQALKEIEEVLHKEENILDELAQSLLEKQELEYDEINQIFQKYGKNRLRYLENLKTAKLQKKQLSWDDLIGMEDIKQEAKEIVNLIKDRSKVELIGGRGLRGLLLMGPPGCGKTYLASIIAAECNLPFISKSGSEFIELYVGVGAKRIRQLFQEAREKSLSQKGCIIFIDELDAIGGKRSTADTGATQEYNQTINQLLIEMDGLKEKDRQYNILVIGATNMDESFLDPALLRPGRFDRKIYVTLPTKEERKQLLWYYLNKIKHPQGQLDLDYLASVTAGWSAADIANLVQEASLIALREKEEQINRNHLDQAYDRISLGLKQKIIFSPEKKRLIAAHEAGHGLAVYFFAPHRKLLKLSVIPRRSSGGVTLSQRQEGQLLTKEELLAEIKIFLAGYTAEKIIFNTSSVGVTSDFKQAFNTAHYMVWKLGMGNSGYFNYAENNNLPISEALKNKLDLEVQEIIQQCRQETENLLNQKKELLEELTARLLEKEELSFEEIETIIKKQAG